MILLVKMILLVLQKVMERRFVFWLWLLGRTPTLNALDRPDSQHDASDGQPVAWPVQSGRTATLRNVCFIVREIADRKRAF
jgi:hypothetical protein